MEQLVGQHCIFCQKRLPWELDACFCSTCGSPVHIECSRLALTAPPSGGCLMCGAPTAVVESLALNKQKRAGEARSRAGLTFIALGVVWFVGGVMATVMCNTIEAGRYVIAIGAILGGIGLIIRGLRQIQGAGNS